MKGGAKSVAPAAAAALMTVRRVIGRRVFGFFIVVFSSAVAADCSCVWWPARAAEHGGTARFVHSTALATFATRYLRTPPSLRYRSPTRMRANLGIVA